MHSQQPTSTAADLLGDIAPKLLELTEKVLFGDVWERPGLSKRDRSPITVSALIALNRTQQLPFHLERALANGFDQGRAGRGDHTPRFLFGVADISLSSDDR